MTKRLYTDAPTSIEENKAGDDIKIENLEPSSQANESEVIIQGNPLRTDITDMHYA